MTKCWPLKEKFSNFCQNWLLLAVEKSFGKNSNKYIRSLGHWVKLFGLRAKKNLCGAVKIAFQRPGGTQWKQIRFLNLEVWVKICRLFRRKFSVGLSKAHCRSPKEHFGKICFDKLIFLFQTMGENFMVIDGKNTSVVMRSLRSMKNLF